MFKSCGRIRTKRDYCKIQNASRLTEVAPSGAAFHFVCNEVRGMALMVHRSGLQLKKGKYD